MFTCTLDHATIATMLNLLWSKLGMCINSRASKDYCLGQAKFTNYKFVQHKITTADGCLLATIGMYGRLAY